ILLDDMYKSSNDINLKLTRDYFRRSYRKSIAEAKSLANSKFVNKAVNKCKAMWNIINQNRSRLKGTVEKSGSNIDANDFNVFFTNIARNITQNFPADPIDPIALMCRNDLNLNSSYFQFSEVSICHVRDIIRGFKSKKSKDIYGMSVDLLKSIIDTIISALTRLVNLCIMTNTFPDCLKKALVVPVFKKGDANDVVNYRPIALLPIFSKKLEKVLSIQLTNYFEEN